MVNNVVKLLLGGGPTCNQYLSSFKMSSLVVIWFGSTALQQDSVEEEKEGYC